jgi:hypothetical protein
MEKTKNRIYFGKKEEQHIRDYLRCDDKLQRKILYTKNIKPVFDKLVESIIFKYNFIHLANSYDELHQEVISHLFLNIDKFKPEMGTKAFSYFGTAAKRYLQQKSIARTIDRTVLVSLWTDDDKENELIQDTYIEFEDEEKNKDDKEFISVLIKYFNAINVVDINEQRIKEAILYFLNNYEAINIHNRKHFYVLIKEYTGLDTRTVTKIMNIFIEKYYAEIKKAYNNYRI